MNLGSHGKDFEDPADLKEKLKVYLESQGETIDDYPYIYLVTAPRFLGYSFNPVSFWYLYSNDKELKAMILEVNNTFGERRLYFLNGSPPPELNGPSKDPHPSKFKATWSKDFHVSPFNSRKGSYALNVIDPFSPFPSSTSKIDNAITLSSSKAHAKLVARVFSTGPSSDPATLGYWSRLRFIAKWWWVGFVTFPRILKEAAKLFFRRKLHVWYRPEVLKDSIGRAATNDEIIIESSFKSLLKHLVATSTVEQPLQFTSSSSAAEYFYSSSKDIPNPQLPPIEFKITSPLFFTRLARHSHISEFLSHEILTDDDTNRTFSTSHPQILLQLFDPSTTTTTTTLPQSPTLHPSPLTRLRWRFLHWLRNRNRNRNHKPQTVPQAHQQRNVQTSDIRHFGSSHLDHFVMAHESRGQMLQYTTVVTKILLSDVIAFGYVEILDAGFWVCKLFVSGLFVVAVRDCWADVLGEEEWRIVRGGLGGLS
ncbi:MAG: hypothetical protein Q9182_005217 [Xanthomendoza sp. 2 TL-2023]